VNLKLPFGENNYPVFTLPPEIKTKVSDNVEYLKNLCIEGLKERYDERPINLRISEGRIR
jgi:DNA polymerase III alpha subunit